jgi:hypothetical protein
MPPGLSPYQTEHINRFGNYVLDFARIPDPLPSQFTVPPPSRTEPLSAALSAQGAQHPDHLSVQESRPEWRKRQARTHEFDDATEQRTT